MVLSLKRFNSRTREGCDLNPFETPYQLWRFNSRTREGCDMRVPYPIVR